MAFQWIGKTDTPRLSWGYNGEGVQEAHDEARKTVTPEKRGVLLKGVCNIGGKVKKAVVKVCGLGLYRFFVNGTECGAGGMAPLETDYRKRVLYDEFDVTGLLANGENAFGIELGNGRYSTRVKYWGWRARWYGDPMAFMELCTEYEDGRTEFFGTDGSWKTAFSAVTDNCFFDGEHFDARLVAHGWNTANFDASAWDDALCVSPPGGNVEKNEYFNIRKIRELEPVLFAEPVFGYWAVKFAENITGRARIRVKGKKGAKVVIRYAERLERGDNEFDTRSNRYSLNTDEYVLDGEGVEEYEPHFTIRSFSACVITSVDREAELVGAVACEVRAKLRDTGTFICDNEKINRLHDVFLRTQRDNLMSVPWDCPQRDERMGWLGDAHITAKVCLYNMDMRSYYRKWFGDIHINIHSESGSVPIISPRVEFEEAADWGAGFPIMLWDYYLFYGDKDVLDEYYDDIEKYYGALVKDGLILKKTRYGDWMSVAEGWKRGDPACCATLYAYYVLKILCDISEVTGRDGKAVLYRQKLSEYAKVIRKEFFREDTCLFDDGSQFSQSFALKLGLIPEERKAEACRKLADLIAESDFHLIAGIHGAKYVMEVLCENGYEDLAMKLILREGFPGWLDLTKNKTTLPERWDGEMSQNHPAFGSLDAVFYSLLGGIRQGEELTVKPYFAKEVNYVKCACETARGAVGVEWKRADGKVSVEVECPDNTTLVLPGMTKILGNGRHTFGFSEY